MATTCHNVPQFQEIVDAASIEPSPLVSVIMATYNHAPYISRAIEDVIKQVTQFRFELIIGEDCSTDGTRSILLDYQRRFPRSIRVLYSERNVGSHKNHLRLYAAARGKYIAFCEGDDYWHHPAKLQKQADYLETHPECGMVHSDYDVYEVGSQKLVKGFLKKRKLEMPNNPGISEIITGCRETFRIQTCTVMALRSLCRQIVEADPHLYLSGHFPMADTQLWAELAALSRIGFIPESLATYRLLPESASRSRDRKKIYRFELSDCEMRLYLCDKYKLPESVRRVPELGWCRFSLLQAFHERNAGLALAVRKKKPAFSWKEWLFYLGARYGLLHSLFRSAAYCRDMTKKLRIR